MLKLVWNPFLIMAVLFFAVAANAADPEVAAEEEAEDAQEVVSTPANVLPELKNIVTTDDCFDNIPEGKSCERSLCLSRTVGEPESVVAESYTACVAANNAGRKAGSDRVPANKEKECSH